jgi:hypothetical protein
MLSIYFLEWKRNHIYQVCQEMLRPQWALADFGLDEGLHKGLYLSRSFWLVLEHR